MHINAYMPINVYMHITGHTHTQRGWLFILEEELLRTQKTSHAQDPGCPCDHRGLEYLTCTPIVLEPHGGSPFSVVFSGSGLRHLFNWGGLSVRPHVILQSLTWGPYGPD